MLAGIKVGKKKQKKTIQSTTAISIQSDSTVNKNNHVDSEQQRVGGSTCRSYNNNNNNRDGATKSSYADDNALVADEIRRSLMGGRLSLQHNQKSTTTVLQQNSTIPITATTAAGAGTDNNNYDTYDYTESNNQHRKRQSQQQLPSSQQQQPYYDAIQNIDESEMNIMELLKYEKSISSKQQEQKSYKQVMSKKKRTLNDNDDDFQYQTHLHTSNYDSKKDNDHERQQDSTKKGKTSSDIINNPRNNNNNNNTKSGSGTAAASILNHIGTNCYWWIQSSNFASHRYIDLSSLYITSSSNNIHSVPQHITLCMVPSSQSLIYGEHFYIVPIEYTPSFSSCDNHIWEEVRIVQTILRNIASQQKKSVIYFETYLGSKSTSSSSSSSSSNNIWQARMEAVFVPLDLYYDTSIYFKSALLEQAEEDGAHQSKILTTTTIKPLHHTVPKHFPYFYVEYNDSDQNDSSSSNDGKIKNTGYVLLIEQSNYHNKFPNTFGIDTIASMLDMEPIRFRNRYNKTRLSDHDEQIVVQQFMNRYRST